MSSAGGWAIWLTGIPASGKTSVARALLPLIEQRGQRAVLIDSDELRAILTPQPRYTDEERDWFYGVITALAAWLTESGINVLIAATANRRAYRDAARQRIARFAEVYVRCPIDVCRARDPKGLYAAATAGHITHLPGIGADYEPPLDPDATIDTAADAPEHVARSLLRQLDRRGLFASTDPSPA